MKLLPGWKTVAVGLNAGAVGFSEGGLLAKLNSDLERADPPKAFPDLPKVVFSMDGRGLKAGAATLKAEAALVGGDILEVCTSLDLIDADGTLADWKLNDAGENMDGLKFALGFPEGLNSFASTLRLDIENLEE